MGLATENQTKLLAQIIDNYERLKEEFMTLNLDEVSENRPELIGLVAMNLNNILAHNQMAFIFLDGVRKATRDEI